MSDDYNFWDDEESLEAQKSAKASVDKKPKQAKRPQQGGSVGSTGKRPIQGGTGGVKGSPNTAGRSGERTTTVVPNPNKGNPNVRPRQQRVQNAKPVKAVQNNSNTTDDFFDERAVVQTPKKKSKVPLLVLGVAVIAIICVVVGMKLGKKGTSPKPADTSAQGYAVLQSALNDYNPEKIDSIVGGKTGDSYLAQEWAYANENKGRQLFIVNVCKAVQLSKGKLTLPDYQKIADEIATTDKEAVNKLLVVSGYTKDDYNWNDECADLLVKYYNERQSIPTITVDIKSAPTGSGVWSDDIELDKLLFSSDAFHNMCDEFDKIMTGFTGYRDEEYYADVEVHNKEYDEWEKLFRKYYNEDNGHFHKGVSKWEPWYLRDENNKLILDKNGKKIVNYYTVKDKNGKDWVQPAETVYVKRKKVRKVEAEYVAEYGVPHCFLGAYYCQNEYTGVLNPSLRVGDGTVEHPAGVGTPIVTKVLCKDGKWHDVRVTMKGYWVGADAITYAVTFSEKNRGLDPNSVVQYITYEIEVENLEKAPITFDSEMVLCDKNLNKSARTGVLYSFNNENITIKGKESAVINDWASSTEIAQKYVIWGKSFNREYASVYFLVLAGTGDIPSYSAYKAFTGESSMSGAMNGQEISSGGDDAPTVGSAIEAPVSDDSNANKKIPTGDTPTEAPAEVTSEPEATPTDNVPVEGLPTN